MSPNPSGGDIINAVIVCCIESIITPVCDISRVVSKLVWNLEDIFSHNEARMKLTQMTRRTPPARPLPCSLSPETSHLVFSLILFLPLSSHSILAMSSLLGGVKCRSQ